MTNSENLWARMNCLPCVLKGAVCLHDLPAPVEEANE